MNEGGLLAFIKLGEDSTRQFKSDIKNAESLASEMAAFANCEGGKIYIGIADDGKMLGLSYKDVSRINQLISNAASQLVRSPLTVQTENIALENDKVIILLTVPKGIDKPYFDKNGVIWLKCGSDKRRVNSKEELRRVFQNNDQFHADEIPVKVGIEAIDKLRFRDFLRDVYKQEYPSTLDEALKLLQNMNLAAENGKLNLAGLLLFGEQPERIKPQFCIKAVSYPGNTIHVSQYLDTEDFEGSLPKLFDGALSFVLRNLHKVQADQNVNSPGIPEIPPVVFEELLVNALIHRDYMISASIKLFIFENRIEIISPGHLPNNLTVEKIRAGNSNIRNPILVSFVAKGLMPYKGLGSGIKRALESWPEIEFIDDREACLFTVIIHRNVVAPSPYITEKSTEKMGRVTEEKEISSEIGSEKKDKSSEKTENVILQLLDIDPSMSIKELAEKIGLTTRAIEKQITRLKKEKRLERVGPDKGGYWKVIK